jgi:hypothetical protein
MTIDEDLRAVRDHLGAANPVPAAHPSRWPGRVPAPAAAGAPVLSLVPFEGRRSPVRWVFVAAVSVAALALVAALVVSPRGRRPTTLNLATGPGAKAVAASYQATRAAGTARGEFTLSFGGRTVSGQGVGDFGTGVAAGTITLPNDVDPVDVVSTGDALYVKLPASYRMITSGKPWVKLDRAALTNLVGDQLGVMGSGGAIAPTDVLNYVKGVSGDVQAVGTEQVRGTGTTHYKANIDLNKVAAQLPAASQAGGRQAATVVGQPVPADLWVDAQGRLRKLTLTIDASRIKANPGSAGPTGTPPTGTGTATFELYDFGAKVTAKPPAPDQVSDIGSMIGSFLGGGGRPTP